MTASHSEKRHKIQFAAITWLLRNEIDESGQYKRSSPKRTVFVEISHAARHTDTAWLRNLHPVLSPFARAQGVVLRGLSGSRRGRSFNNLDIPCRAIIQWLQFLQSNHPRRLALSNLGLTNLLCLAMAICEFCGVPFPHLAR